MSQEPAIIVKDISKEFILPQHKHTSLKQVVVNLGRGNVKKKQKALDNINFTVEKGDFFGIVGRNGSGKSTLLKILAGVYTPTKGGVIINGNLTPFIELGVGFNPQLSGRDNVFLNGSLLGFSHKEMAAMYDDIVEFAELEQFMDQKLKNYSSGMQVRLAFSISIRAKSDILLLDEVLAVGDAAFQQKCYNHFEELKREKRTVVFVTHDMGAVRRFCNKALYITEGKITHIGTPSEIADVYTLENIQDTQEDKTEDGPVLSKVHNISSKMSKTNENTVSLTISYSSKDEDEMYIGLGILRDGVSVAEITTPLDKLLKGSGKATYVLDTNILNPGVYYIGASLFRASNRELVAKDKKYNEFFIKGEDITRGAALKLPSTWKTTQ
jgi:ABC-2 type transport system ATP-binding protein